MRTASITAVGSEGDGTVNTCEPLINVVTSDKPKMLIGLSQKARGQEKEFTLSFSQTIRPPANRRNLTHSWIWT